MPCHALLAPIFCLFESEPNKVSNKLSLLSLRKLLSFRSNMLLLLLMTMMTSEDDDVRGWWRQRMFKTWLCSAFRGYFTVNYFVCVGSFKGFVWFEAMSFDRAARVESFDRRVTPQPLDYRYASSPPAIYNSSPGSKCYWTNLPPPFFLKLQRSN